MHYPSFHHDARHEPWIETRYAAEETRVFYARVRADKMLASWASARLGLTAAQAQAYLAAVLHADISHRDHEELLCMVAGDLACAHPDDPEAHHAAVALRLAQFLARALADLAGFAGHDS